MTKIRDWWGNRSNFEQFWLFWFVVVLGGLGIVELGLLIFGVEE